MIHFTHPTVLLGPRWLSGWDHLSRGGDPARHYVWVWAHLLDWPHWHWGWRLVYVWLLDLILLLHPCKASMCGMRAVRRRSTPAGPPGSPTPTTRCPWTACTRATARSTSAGGRQTAPGCQHGGCPYWLCVRLMYSDHCVIWLHSVVNLMKVNKFPYRRNSMFTWVLYKTCINMLFCVYCIESSKDFQTLISTAAK